MKILLVSQRFYPESFRINDIAKELVQRGHSITILTGLPNYPEGYIYSNYRNGKNRLEKYFGATIIRVGEIARRKNVIFRFLNYYSFPFLANNIINKLDDDFDVVFVNQLSPIMMVNPALKYKAKHKAKIVMYEMDLWPESLLAGGAKKESWLYRYYKKVSVRIYSNIDSILVSSKGHINYIRALSTLPKITYLPQYPETVYSKVLKKERNNIFNFVFAGNIGKAQNLDNFLDACLIAHKGTNHEFNVYLIGDGSERSRLRQKCKDLNLDHFVFFPGKQSTENVIDYYNNADALVVTLEKSDYAILTVPGKVQSYMLAGKPILSAASGETNDLITEADCGLVCSSDDVKSIAEKILHFISMDTNLLKQYGDNAKRYCNQHFDKNDFISFLEKELLDFSKSSV